MAAYVFLSFEKLIFKLDDKNSTDYGLLDLVELGQINYNSTNMFNFYVLRKQVPIDTALYLTKELEQYVHISFR